MEGNGKFEIHNVTEFIIFIIFSYIAYVYDEATSCEECKINRTVTVINPVIIMIDWVVDKVIILTEDENLN